MSDDGDRLRTWLQLEWVDDDGGDLYADVERVEKMVEAYLSAPALAAIAMVKVDDRKPKKVTAKTRGAVAATRKGSLVEYYDRPDDERRVFAEFNLNAGLIDLRSVIAGEELTKHRKTALDDLSAALVRVAEVWRGVAFVRDASIKFEYAAKGPPYARLRVPRTHSRFPKRSLVTFLDARREDRAADFKALTEPKPAHATVTKHGDLVEIRWAKTLDDADVAQASTWHDCWIRRIETERDHEFNELGDELVSGGNGKPLAPLSFYNPWWKRAFQEVTELEGPAWEDACEVLKAGVIRDENGEEDKVEKMWIVLPTREEAIAAHARVVAAGFEAAVYPGPRPRRKDFFDPVPKGPWLTESTDNGKPRG